MTKDANFVQIMSSDAERSKLNQSLRALEKETSKLEDDIKKAMQLINENDNLKKEVETDKNVHERLQKELKQLKEQKLQRISIERYDYGVGF